MSLLFVDSFDHYNDVLQKWTGGANITAAGGSRNIAAAAARNGANGMGFTGANNTGIYMSVPTGDEFYMGVAFRAGSSGTTHIFVLSNGTTKHLELQRNTSDLLVVTRNNTVLATGTTTININTWYYLEMWALIADSGGRAIVRINGVEDINFTGDTRNGATLPTRCGLGAQTGSGAMAGAPLHFDDYYLADAAGSQTFLGDLRVAALMPDGAGTSTQFTPDSGSNYARVNETPPDDDTSYVASSTVGHKDTYSMGNLPTTAETVHGVQQMIRARKDDAGARTGRMVVRSGGADYESSDIPILDTYAYHLAMRETDPATSAAWTNSGVNALEHGPKVEA